MRPITLFHIVDAIVFLFSLLGLIKSYKDEASGFFGQIKIETHEWWFLLLVPIVVPIIVHWRIVVKWLAQSPEQDKLDELLFLIYRDRGTVEIMTAQIEQGRFISANEVLDINRRVNEMLYMLGKLGFTIPSQEELGHEKFLLSWYYFINRLEIIIKNEDYKNHLNLWSNFSPIKFPP